MRKCKVNWGDEIKDKEIYYFHGFYSIYCDIIRLNTVMGILENIETGKLENVEPIFITFIDKPIN